MGSPIMLYIFHNMKRYFFFFFFFLLIFNASGQNYYALINKAELAIVDSAYSKAGNYYRKAFSIKGVAKLDKDLFNYLLCSIFQDNYKESSAIVDSLAQRGFGLQFFEKNIFLKDYRNTSNWHCSKEKIDSLNLYYKNSIDSIYTTKMNGFVAVDQKFANDTIHKCMFEENLIQAMEYFFAYTNAEKLPICSYPWLNSLFARSPLPPILLRHYFQLWNHCFEGVKYGSGCQCDAIRVKACDVNSFLIPYVEKGIINPRIIVDNIVPYSEFFGDKNRYLSVIYLKKKGKEMELVRYSRREKRIGNKLRSKLCLESYNDLKKKTDYLLRFSPSFRQSFFQLNRGGVVEL